MSRSERDTGSGQSGPSTEPHSPIPSNSQLIAGSLGADCAATGAATACGDTQQHLAATAAFLLATNLCCVSLAREEM